MSVLSNEAELRFVLTLTGPRFSANDRLHFRKERALKQAWRDLGQVHARAAIGSSFTPLQRAHVVVTQIPGSRRRTDPGNIAPAAKAAIDGIVLAGMLVDDDAEHMLGPDFRLGEPQPQSPGMWTLRFTVEPLGPTGDGAWTRWDEPDPLAERHPHATRVSATPEASR